MSSESPVIRRASLVVRTFRERLLSGLSWNILSALALQGSVLVSTVVVARILGLQSFGAYSMLVSTVMTIATIAQSGSGLVATKYVAEFLSEDPRRVGRLLAMCRVLTLATGSIAALLVLATADIIGGTLLDRPELASQVRIVALAILFQVSVAYQFGALQGFGAFRELGRAGVIAGLGHIAFTAIGAWLGQFVGATIGFVIASAFRTIVFAAALSGVCRRHGVAERAPPRREDFALVWRFGLPAGLAGFVTMPCLWFVTVLVARLPGGLAQVAIFNVGHQIRQAVLQLPSLLNAVSFSILSRLKGLDAAADFRRVFWTNLAVNATFSSLTIAALTLFVEPLLRLYGRDFADGRVLVVVLLLAVIPESLAMSFYQLIQSAGRMWYSLFAIVIPRDLLYVALAGILIGEIGVVGAAAAYPIAWIVALILIFIGVRQKILG